MNAAIQCIVLLACAAVCTSTVIKRCQCLNTTNSVELSLIADVIEYAPRPYCSKREVIAVLKDKSSRCLNPKVEFTQAVLLTIRIQRARRKATKPKTTTA